MTNASFTASNGVDEARTERSETAPSDLESLQVAPAIDPEAMRTHAADASRLLKALANEKRLMLLCLLFERERSVGELNARVALSQSALSQHLAVLREDGLVNTRRDAQVIYYSLAEGPAQRVIATLHGIYCGDQSTFCS